MSNDATYSAIRKAVLQSLRDHVPLQQRRIPGNWSQRLRTVEIARGLAQKHPEWPATDIWRSIQDLLVQGVLLIGDYPVISNPFDQAGDENRNLPFVSVSDYGIRFLEGLKDDPDPYDAVSILDPLRARGIANVTVEAYVPEAVCALDSGAYRGACILVGVAAEAISEDLYTALLDHLQPGPRETFRQALDAKKTSAESRWKSFVSRFPAGHKACLGDELDRRFDNVLEPLVKMLKQNRDDGAHRRATLISRYTAQVAVSALVPFGITAADVIVALKRPCVSP